MSQSTSAQNDAQPAQATYNHDDEVHLPNGHKYAVQSTYQGTNDTPYVHLRRINGTHDMYLATTTLDQYLHDDWTYHPDTNIN